MKEHGISCQEAPKRQTSSSPSVSHNFQIHKIRITTTFWFYFIGAAVVTQV